MGELKKIMAVDDNAVNLSAIERVLKTEYEVFPMISGKRAIKFLEGHTVDLILLDVEMPDMNGIETLQAIRNIVGYADIPVILLSARRDQNVEAMGIELGIKEYMIKPVADEVLRDRLAKYLSLINKEDGFTVNAISENIAIKLEEIVSDLSEYRSKEALDKCRALIKEELPDTLSESVLKAIDLITNYDDEEAEELLLGLLDTRK